MDTQDDIFAVARELPADERESYLAAACESPEQRRRVEEMLHDADEADDFFSRVEPPPVPVVAEKPGDMVGRYKLLQRIGEGGFGVVFMAEQREPIVRRVALKVIRAGLDTREVIARFEAERQALAMMDHPGIARVLDAGATDTGRPYFVMELVRGLPITTFCDLHEFDTMQRLELFMGVCAAVQHAHQKGIIHRDLKPSNIIVGLDGDRPVAKVIDFGIAKATQQQLTEKTLFTRFEQFIGTPLYISPEQASLSAIDIDTRSDLYSLGVLLYELLTGKPPIDASELMAAGFDEMRRIIREKEAPRPSTRLATIDDEEIRTIAKARHTEPRHLGLCIRGELDWIALKALEKDRSRRYQTANALRDDIDRFLRNEPVSAAAPSRIYQMRKFMARHRVAMLAAGAVAVAMVIATAISMRQAVRAKRAEDLAVASLAEVAAERDRKDQARREAEAVSDFMIEIFRSPDPSRDGRGTTVAETLDRAAKRLESEFSARPERRAGFQAALGKTYHALGRYPEAIELERKAYHYFRNEAGEEDPRSLEVATDLAISYRYGGSPGYAIQLQEKVLEIYRRIHGADHRLTLGVMQDLAISYDDMSRASEALELRARVADGYRRIHGEDHPRTLGAIQNLAISHERAGRRELALELREETLEKLREVSGARHPETLRAMANLAVSYDHAGRREESLAIREEALAVSRVVRGDDHPDTLQLIDGLAWSYEQAGRLDEMKRLNEEAAASRRRFVEATRHEPLPVLVRRVGSYERSGRPREAMALRAEIGRRAETELAANPAAIQATDLELLVARIEHRVMNGRWEAARNDADRLLDLDPTGLRFLQLAALQLRINDRDAWDRLRQRALATFGAEVGNENAEKVAKICWLMRETGAEPEGVRALVDRARAGADAYLLPWALLTRAMGEFRRGDFEAAAASLDECLAKDFADEGRALAHALRAMVRHRLGQSEAARDSLAESGRLLGDALAQPGESSQTVPLGQWHDWLIARSFHSEARDLLAGEDSDE